MARLRVLGVAVFSMIIVLAWLQFFHRHVVTINTMDAATSNVDDQSSKAAHLASQLVILKRQLQTKHELLAKVDQTLSTTRPSSKQRSDPDQEILNSNSQLQEHLTNSRNHLKSVIEQHRLGVEHKGIDEGLTAMTFSQRSHARPIAFFKTHKTGSTTVSSILFRHAARHGLTIAGEGLIVLEKSVALVEKSKTHDPKLRHAYDCALFHLKGQGGKFTWKSQTRLESILKFYQELLSPNAVINQDNTPPDTPPLPLIITLLRNPATRTRSHFDYYIGSFKKVPGGFASWLERKRDAELRNFQAVELNLAKMTLALDFIKRNLAPTLGLSEAKDIHLVMVVEKLDASLLLLRRVLKRGGWDCDLIDLIHVSQKMSFNWEGGHVPKSDMTTEQRELLEDRNNIDMVLWEAASARIDKLIELEKENDGDGGKLFDKEMEKYMLLQARLKSKCDKEPSLPFIGVNEISLRPNSWKLRSDKVLSTICDWYSLDDLHYVNLELQSAGNPGTLYRQSNNISTETVLATLGIHDLN
eukprot:m.71798 g.71798  ORF g.71798 m.71798 type:complete len:528 (+) comp24393_c1_seq4:274-1857(+)